MSAMQDTEGARPPELSRPVAVAPSAATSLNAENKPRSKATPAAPIAVNAAPDQGNARCRHIIEKAELGEPLSQDEKRELANSCR
jgi:hypothetical protein